MKRAKNTPQIQVVINPERPAPRKARAVLAVLLLAIVAIAVIFLLMRS